MKTSITRNGIANKLSPEDRAAHDWYRFVLSYPPHLVRDYLQQFGVGGDNCVLDPFCGTGTTLVECKKQGIPSVGIEANRMAHFAAQVKVAWDVEPDGLFGHAQHVANAAREALAAQGIADGELLTAGVVRNRNGHPLRGLPPEAVEILLADSISPLPLHKTLVLLDHIQQLRDEHFERYELLALAKALVFSISNLRFGPEVGVGKIRDDAPVVELWLSAVGVMASDLRALAPKAATPATVHLGDARDLAQTLQPNSIDAIITSPPYPNEKDYTRTTRLESILLGFLTNKADLRLLKQGLMRSNTRNVYKHDEDDQWVLEHPEIQRIAGEIEARRLELGKTSGFEKLYGKVTKLYFGGMARHFAALRSVLRPGARLAYVVGDQASYLRVMIRTGQLLADIADRLGYEVVNIDLFRTRWATATKEQLREEVVVLRWPGDQPRTIKPGRETMASGKKKATPKTENVTPTPLFPETAGEVPAVEEHLKEYDQIIERVFRTLHEAVPGGTSLAFTLKDVKRVAVEMGLEQENAPDIAYTYRTGRSALPKSILAHGHWAIMGAGKGKYEFVRLNRSPYVTIPDDLTIYRILDATPQVVLKYQGKDEQSLLARIRYNRLVDVFTSLTTYHLQSHLRTTVKGLGQVEMDDLYIGIDKVGNGYVIPVEAKAASVHDQLGVVQITQMVRFAKKQFPDLQVRPIGVKVLGDTLVFVAFTDAEDANDVSTTDYKRYLLYREK